jgi:hypothetical protein
MIYLYKNDLDLFKSKYVSVSKEPFQFISFFISYYNYLSKGIEIRIPILFDASCSGIQHLSALTTDKEIAKLVNILPGLDDKPSDFYQFCIEEIIENIKQLPPEDEIFKNKILQLNINRKWLKHSIMTIPYNVTTTGIADKLSENFNREFITLKKAEDLINKGIISESTIKKNIGALRIDTEDIELRNNDMKAPLKGANDKEITIKIGSEVGKAQKGIYILSPKKEILSENPNLIFTQAEIYKFSNIIKYTVISIIPPFTQLKKYFDSIIEIMKRINLTIF